MNRMTTSYLIRVGILSALAWGLMLVAVPLLPGANYLTWDAGDLPALVAAFALGPAAGVLVELIKNLLHLLASGKATLVGEAANFVAGASFTLVAGLLYWRHKTRWMAALSLAAGSLVMTAVMAIANTYIFLPLWNVPREAIPQMITSVIIPFNLLKGGLSSAVTFVVYKRVRGYLALERPAVATVQPEPSRTEA